MDHFNETAYCQIVDRCDNDADGYSTPSAAYTRSLLSIVSTATATTSPSPSQLDTTTATAFSECNQWRPSEKESTSCTNRIVPGDVHWPVSMVRRTSEECCRDFYKGESCAVVDVC